MILSKKLQLDFDLIIVRKIQIPGNTEAGFGALAWKGEVFLNEDLLKVLRLTNEQIDQQIAIVKDELALRNKLFRMDRPLPDYRQKACR